MPFAKLVKNKAYYKRFQTKYRRRREGRTDYYARLRMCLQDKNKYNTPKYRLVVRFTNTDIICQIVHATLKGDLTMAAAYSHELGKYGAPVGHTNYAAAYATGLLLARRVLTKLKLADAYKGKEKVDGEMYIVEPLDDGPRPFYAILDVGLRRTTTGAKLFGCLKGAVDGGIEVPHTNKRFPGYKVEEGTASYKAEVHKARIFGTHVSAYMKTLQADDPEKYRTQFSDYVKAGIAPDAVEAMWKKAHAAIRANPVATKKAAATKEAVAGFKSYSRPKLTRSQRNDRIRQKFAHAFPTNPNA